MSRTIGRTYRALGYSFRVESSTGVLDDDLHRHLRPFLDGGEGHVELPLYRLIREGDEFVASLDGRTLGSGRTPTGRPAGEGSGGGGIGRGLHAEQEFHYHRPAQPGDILSATSRPGERWEKEGRSGKLVFSESITEYRDQAGELVVTARSVGVLTERPVTSEVS